MRRLVSIGSYTKTSLSQVFGINISTFRKWLITTELNKIVGMPPCNGDPFHKNDAIAIACVWIAREFYSWSLLQYKKAVTDQGLAMNFARAFAQYRQGGQTSFLQALKQEVLPVMKNRGDSIERILLLEEVIEYFEKKEQENEPTAVNDGNFNRQTNDDADMWNFRTDN